ncbi:unnamed protein product [Leptosia nina]|uniref:AB hydrolase-1 domain-containing protein n=1 Tax=Leptosia nina TaxID=320188 RepID=A0AAV1K2P6_9NEOP
MNFQEWNLKVPWGNLALLSYGNPSGDPVLVVHGRLDSAATFIPLLKLLPTNYHYVLFDMPGHGRSDPFWKGQLPNRFLGVPVIELVVKHLRWKEFIYIGHSLGAEQGLFYAAMYPKQIKKAIYFDIGPSVIYCCPQHFRNHFQATYEAYYDNYRKYDSERTMTEGEARQSVTNARQLSDEDADIVLSRNLVEVSPGSYKLTWDRRFKILPGFNSLHSDFYHDLFTMHPTPALFICAKDMRAFYQPSGLAVKVMSTLTARANVKVIWVDGGHDVHLTNPERFASELVQFLESDVARSKL